MIAAVKGLDLRSGLVQHSLKRLIVALGLRKGASDSLRSMKMLLK